MNWKVWVALVVGLVLGFISASVVQELLDAMKRSWAKRTAADCRSISIALEHFRQDTGQYPPLDGNIEHLVGYLSPKYMRQFPRRDMSNQPYLVVMDGAKAAVISVGRYGTAAEDGKVIRGGPW
jgi:type II secretory pathway pseudopilin PulG